MELRKDFFPLLKVSDLCLLINDDGKDPVERVRFNDIEGTEFSWFQ